MAKTKKVQETLGQRLTKSLQGAVDSLKRGEALSYRTVVMQLEPSAYTPTKIVATRDLLAVSQGMFAQFLGVSPSTIRAWEQGAKDPSNMACRFMDEIRKNPDYWRNRMRESLKLKTTVK